MNSFTPQFAIDVASPDAKPLHVLVRGDLDLTTSRVLGEALERALDDGNSVVLDLSAVTFIDSTGLSTLIRALRQSESNGGALALSPNLPAQIRRVFEITGLNGLFPIARH